MKSDIARLDPLNMVVIKKREEQESFIYVSIRR